MAEYYYNNKSYNERELKKEFLNTSLNFSNLPNGVVAVLDTPKPIPTTELKRVVRNGVTIDGLGNTVQDWIEVSIFTSDLLDVDGVTVLKTIAVQESDYQVKLLDKAKTNKIELSVKKYQASRFVDVAYMSTTFQADKASQEMIISVLSAGAVPTGFYWVDATNVQVAMTFADLQGLSGTILGSAQIAFDLYQTEKASITAIVIDSAGTYPTYADAVAALDAIVI